MDILKPVGGLLLSLLLAGAALAKPVLPLKIIGNGVSQPMSAEAVRSLYLFASPTNDIVPVAYPKKHPNRLLFNTYILGLTESRLQSYWAQRRFSGKKVRPLVEFQSAEQIIDYIQRTPNAVAYIPSDVALPAGVSQLYPPVE